MIATLFLQALHRWGLVQIDPEKGTQKALVGVTQRLAEPDLTDIVSPFFAFFMVVILPSLVALWVIYRTLTEKDDPPKANG